MLAGGWQTGRGRWLTLVRLEQLPLVTSTKTFSREFLPGTSGDTGGHIWFDRAGTWWTSLPAQRGANTPHSWAATLPPSSTTPCVRWGTAPIATWFTSMEGQPIQPLVISNKSYQRASDCCFINSPQINKKCHIIHAWCPDPLTNVWPGPVFGAHWSGPFMVLYLS